MENIYIIMDPPPIVDKKKIVKIIKKKIVKKNPNEEYILEYHKVRRLRTQNNLQYFNGWLNKIIKVNKDFLEWYEWNNLQKSGF
jgi:hypothetical protein